MTMRPAVSWSTHGLDSNMAKTRREQVPSLSARRAVSGNR